MKYLSTVGLCLSLVFGCLLLALIAELYYLLWWKKRINNGGIENGEFFYTFCCRKSSSISSRRSSEEEEEEEVCSSESAQNHLNANKDMWYNSYGDEDSIDAELMRLQHMAGPPRFLFTIKEETKEDLEQCQCETGKSRKGSRSRSLSTDVFHLETPYLTPLASPSYFTPPLTPIKSSQNQSFFEFASDAEFNRLRSSPPPSFKFLRDAEDKLYRTKLEDEDDENGFSSFAPSQHEPEPEHEHYVNGSFITIVVGKEEKENEVQCSSSSSTPNKKGFLHYL